MSTTVGINGFGPIGQAAFFALLADPSTTVTAVVDATVSAAFIAYVVEQEYPRRNPSGPLMRVTDVQKDQIVLNDTHVVHVSSAQDPQSSLWRQYGAHYVLECTGLYTTRSRSWGHVTGGAAAVVIAAASADTSTVTAASPAERLASSLPVCAAGAPIGAAIAPVLAAVAAAAEVEHASYTALCGPQPPRPIGAKSGDARDWRQARLQSFASGSMAPIRDTGAETVAALVPQLAGRVSAGAYQVPVAQGCAIDLVVQTKGAATVDSFASSMAQSAAEVKVCAANCPLISADCIGSPQLLFDVAASSSSADGKVHRLVLWVDVECYYAALLVSLVKNAVAAAGPAASAS